MKAGDEICENFHVYGTNASSISTNSSSEVHKIIAMHTQMQLYRLRNVCAGYVFYRALVLFYNL